jgi:hypothetical protein
MVAEAALTAGLLLCLFLLLASGAGMTRSRRLRASSDALFARAARALAGTLVACHSGEQHIELEIAGAPALIRRDGASQALLLSVDLSCLRNSPVRLEALVRWWQGERRADPPAWLARAPEGVVEELALLRAQRSARVLAARRHELRLPIGRVATLSRVLERVAFARALAVTLVAVAARVPTGATVYR